MTTTQRSFRITGGSAARRAVRLVLFAVGTIAVGASCDSPTYVRPEAAYSPTTLTQGRLYRWSNHRTLRVWIGDSSTTANEIFVATAIAANEWNSIPIFGEYRVVAAQSIAEANILLIDRGKPLPFTVPASCPFVPEGIGYTYFCVNGDRAVNLTVPGGSVATVVISIDRSAVTSPDHLAAVIAHELGHALGIGGHSTVPDDVMALPAGGVVPTVRDMDTMRFVLGQRPDFRL